MESGSILESVPLLAVAIRDTYLDCLRTLEAQHLAQFQGCPTHLGELGHETLHVPRTEHDRPSVVIVAACSPAEALAHGSQSHRGGQTTVLP